MSSSMAKMKKSPIYPKYETGYEFDPQVDFTQFLKEARTHACQENFEAATPHSSEEAGKKQLVGRQKQKKSWRSSLFSWLKSEKKSKMVMEEEPSKNSYNITKAKRGYVSGPIHGIRGWATTRPRRPTSGPLSGVFNQTKKMEDELPYVCLDQINNPHGLQSYVPVYMVT